MIDRNTLKIIGEAIKKIEDRDYDYQNNSTWQDLRALQDKAFKEFAEQEIELSKTKYANCTRKEYIDRINTYKEYLEFVEDKKRGRIKNTDDLDTERYKH